jgi:hypothetical protein
MAPGSYLIISQGHSGSAPREGAEDASPQAGMLAGVGRK